MSKEFQLSKEEIITKIESIYGDEKGKNFISHLIRSFFPVHKAIYLLDNPKDHSKLVCCITGHQLFSKKTILDKESSDDVIKKRLKLTTTKILGSEQEKEDAQKKIQELNYELYQGKLLAIYSEESDKYFCQPAFEAFHEWLTKKIINSDNHINWVLKSHQKNEAIKYAKSKNIPATGNPLPTSFHSRQKSATGSISSGFQNPS